MYRNDNALLIATIALLFFSIVAVFSLSLFPTIYFGASHFDFIKKQTIAVFISLIILLVIGRMNPYNVFKPLGFLLFFVSLLAIVVMLFLPHSMVHAVLGAKRWIRFGPISLAPTEFFKYGFVFFISWSLARKYELLQNKHSFFQEIGVVMPYFLLLAFAAGFIAIGQKDLGQVVVLIGVLFALFYLAGLSRGFFSVMVVLFIVALITLIKIASHRVARFKGWWVGVQDSILSILPDSLANKLKVTDTTVPLHIINSRYAIHNGGILGQGLGEGQFKLGYLSEVHTDFVLSGLSEEIGFLGLVVVVGLLLFIIYRIFWIGSKLKDISEKFFVYGVGIVLFLEFIINAFGITGIIPIKGIAVPFLSYGGSQTIASSLAVAMVLMLSRKVKV